MNMVDVQGVHVRKGNSVRRVEEELAKMCERKECVATSSCRNAFYLLLRSLSFGSEDEIIIPRFICESIPDAARAAGAEVVFCDPDSDTFNLTAQGVSEKITARTKAVLFVHTYGNPSGILGVREVCDQHSIILIEDIAHALGARVGEKPAGSIGDYAIYSFTKQMVNVGGGAVLGNWSLEKVRELRHELVGRASMLDYPKRLVASLYETRAFRLSKFLIDLARKKADLKLANSLSPHFFCSSIEARMLLRQLKSLPSLIERRGRQQRYLAQKVKTQRVEEGCESVSNYLTFIFSTKEQAEQACRMHHLFLPVWKGWHVGERIVFVPNSVTFSVRELDRMIGVYTKIYKGS